MDGCCMNDVVREWIAKAEADYATARRESAVRRLPNYDAVCFHSQQCIEKHLKAVIIAHGSIPPKTHDLVTLGRIVVNVCRGMRLPEDQLQLLSRAAVNFRYPGETADKDDARITLKVCRQLRSTVRRAILSTTCSRRTSA